MAENFILRIETSLKYVQVSIPERKKYSAIVIVAEMRCNMIHFYSEPVAKVLEIIIDSSDCANIRQDLNRIEQAKINVNLYGNLVSAYKLDQELREKYPCIHIMNDYAKAIDPQILQNTNHYTPSEAIVSNLDNDKYGILCDTALRKGVIQEIKQFIQSVG